MVKIVNDLNVRKQAKELGISIWYTPSFLFMVMGAIAVVMMTATYYVSKNYDSPEMLVIAESIVVVIIFIIGNSVIRGVEEVARLNKLKSEFISVASHQLRTPLSAMKWETEILLSKHKEGMTERQKECVTTVRAMAFRMTKLVNDLLDVARIEQGRMILRKDKVDFIGIVNELLHEMEGMTKAKNIRIVFDKESESLPFLGDAEKIKLIMDNLIGNAIKYISSHGKIEIKVRKRKGLLICSIKDNGVGIPEKQQGQIFNKFFRSDNVVKYQTEGTGLGLYIAKNIVEQAGGEIGFKSKEDVGTVFTFTLPMESAD